MRRIIAITYLSLDGVMQSPGNPEEDPSNGFELGGWMVPYWDEMMDKSISDLMDKPFELLLGRKTYEIFARYWPKSQDNPIGQKFNATTKHVLTRTPHELDWIHSKRVEKEAVEGVSQLKSSRGPQLHIWGSGNVLQTLAAANLVDEYKVWIFPLLLGHGKRLFGTNFPTMALKLTDTQISSTGVTINTYQPAGPVVPGASEK